MSYFLDLCRANLGETSNREGTHWIRLGQDKERKIIFKQFEFAGNSLWAIDIKNNIWFKEELEEDIMSKKNITNFYIRERDKFPVFQRPIKSEKVTLAMIILYIYLPNQLAMFVNNLSLFFSSCSGSKHRYSFEDIRTH